MEATLPPTMEPKSEPDTPWESIRNEELMGSDFSIYDDLDYPYMFMCSHFVYRNKVQIKKDEEIRVAMAEHRKRSRNLTVFDAISPPAIARLCGGIRPDRMDDDLRLELTPLCKLALEKYNAENQGANFVFDGILKSTHGSSIVYYMTFQAKDAAHPSNCPAITFQAEVFCSRSEPPVVESCAMKPT